MQKPTRLWKCFFRKHLWSTIQNNGRIYFHRMQFVTCLPLYTQKSWAMGELQGQNYNRNGSFSELYVGIHNGAEFFMKPLLKIQEPSMTLFFFLKALPIIFFSNPLCFVSKCHSDNFPPINLVQNKNESARKTGWFIVLYSCAHRFRAVGRSENLRRGQFVIWFQ